MKKDLSRNSIGLALGGLAGNNAHGAGVLQAMLDEHKKLAMISCTSGQIHWLHRYLKHLKHLQNIPGSRPKGLLRSDLQADINDARPTNIEALDAAIVSTTGKKDICRPAWKEWPVNVMRNLSEVSINIWKNISPPTETIVNSYREFARLLPSQTLVPLFSDDFYQEISEELTASKDIGCVFNSYDIKNGLEYVYGNDAAFDILGIDLDNRNEYKYRHRTIYKQITPQAVREGLWIYEYGKPEGPPTIDGAYYRQIILSELAPVHKIYVARPINSKWLGDFPESWLELQDLKTEINFNGAYIGELDKIELINKLIKENKVLDVGTSAADYHHIEILPIEIQVQRGFFDYGRESLDIFDQAYKETLKVFTRTDSKQSKKIRTKDVS